MYSDIIAIVLFSAILNWMISLSILTQVSNSSKIRIRAAILNAIAGIALGCILYIL